MTRSQVITLYKNLLYMGREYPQGYIYFRDKAHNAFMRNKDVNDPEKIQELLRFGDYIMKELTALYSLKKYRTMKNRYYKDPLPEEDLTSSIKPPTNPSQKPPVS